MCIFCLHICLYSHGGQKMVPQTVVSHHMSVENPNLVLSSRTRVPQNYILSHQVGTSKIVLYNKQS